MSMPGNPDPRAAMAARARHEVRLRMKPHTGTPGQVDGAWWPRSRNQATEFPELVLAISSWVGPVRCVTYHVDDWTPTTPELVVEGWLVTLVAPPRWNRTRSWSPAPIRTRSDCWWFHRAPRVAWPGPCSGQRPDRTPSPAPRKFWQATASGSGRFAARLSDVDTQP